MHTRLSVSERFRFVGLDILEACNPGGLVKPAWWLIILSSFPCLGSSVDALADFAVADRLAGTMPLKPPVAAELDDILDSVAAIFLLL